MLLSQNDMDETRGPGLVRNLTIMIMATPIRISLAGTALAKAAWRVVSICRCPIMPVRTLRPRGPTRHFRPAHVLGIRDRLKVRGPHAGWVQAEVIQNKASGDGADHLLIEPAVSANQPAIDSEAAIALQELSRPARASRVSVFRTLAQNRCSAVMLSHRMTLISIARLSPWLQGIRSKPSNYRTDRRETISWIEAKRLSHREE